MAVRRLAETQPDDFTFTPKNLEWAKAKIGDYPQGRQQSAVIPLLWRAQEQNEGWLPEPAIRLVADMLDMPYIRAFEIATFYTMFQLKPVGTVAHIGVCGTTPCMLRGSEEIVKVCKERIAAHPFDLSSDGRFSWEEVECAGACVNGPMIQIGAATYEDLDEATFRTLLDKLDQGEAVEPGPQSARRCSEPLSGATTLKDISHPAEGEAAAPTSDTPDEGLDPAHPAAEAQMAGFPTGRGRAEVEAARNGGPTDDDDDAPGENTARFAALGAEAPRPPIDVEAASTVTGPPQALTGEARGDAPSGKTGEAGDDAPAGDGDDAARSDEPPVAEAEAEADVARHSPSEASESRAVAEADEEGRRPPTLTREAVDEVDDLRRISGIGPKMEATLHELGIFTFEQIADWDEANVEWVSSYLAFKGRIARERWVEQARAIIEEARDKTT